MTNVNVPASCGLDPSHRRLRQRYQQRNQQCSDNKPKLASRRQGHPSIRPPSISADTSTWTNQILHLTNCSMDHPKPISENIPMRGCAIRPLIGPASQTRLVTCSDIPSDRRNGVPYLADVVYQFFWRSRSITYPSSTVHAIWAPAMDILRVMRFHVVKRVRPGSLACCFCFAFPSIAWYDSCSTDCVSC
jgi:hypothetical protein